MNRNAQDDEIPLLTLMPLLYKQVMASSAFKTSGFTKTQIIIMSALASRGPLRMTQVAETLSSSKEQATRAVAPLVKEGLVKRTRYAANRTRVYVDLTEKGSDFMEKSNRAFDRYINEKLARSVTPEEKEELHQAVNVAIRALDKIED